MSTGSCCGGKTSLAGKPSSKAAEDLSRNWQWILAETQPTEEVAASAAA